MELATMIFPIFQREEHGNISLQYPFAHSHFLDGRFPISCPVLHHWSISRKVHPSESGLVDKAVAFVTVKAIEVKEAYETTTNLIFLLFLLLIIIIIIINIIIFLKINY